MLRAAGFADVQVDARPITLTCDSLEDCWRIQTDLAPPPRGALAALPADAASALKARVFAPLKPHMAGSAVRLAAVPLCASARRAT